jgi:hypothetical protein
MKELLPYLAGWIALVGVMFWSVTRVRYRITRRYLEILLFGIRVRRIDLADIRYVSKSRSRWCEKWPNTFFPRKRLLIIHRRSGLFKDVMITPTHRYAFKRVLKEQMRRRKEQLERV